MQSLLFQPVLDPSNAPPCVRALIPAQQVSAPTMQLGHHPLALAGVPVPKQKAGCAKRKTKICPSVLRCGNKLPSSGLSQKTLPLQRVQAHKVVLPLKATTLASAPHPASSVAPPAKGFSHAVIPPHTELGLQHVTPPCQPRNPQPPPIPLTLLPLWSQSSSSSCSLCSSLWP